MMRPLWRTGLSALTLATLWLYPLINALSRNAYWLHWRTQDTLETVAAWLLLAAVFAATLLMVEKRQSPRLAEILTALLLGVGGVAVAGALVKIGWWNAFTGSHRELAPWIASAALAAYGCVAVYWALGRKRAARRPLRHVTLLLSPLIFVMWFNLTAASSKQLKLPATAASPAGQPAVGAAPKKALTVILLFDELSVDFFDRPESVGPSSAQFRRQATVHSPAYLPGGSTEKAIPALFLGSKADPHGADAKARSIVSDLTAAGRDVRVWGWYLDYCADLALTASHCHAVSIYNPRTLDDSISPLNPLWTTLNLLPSTPPFDTLKAGPALHLHRQTLLLARQWIQRQMADETSDVIYAHLNVPHLPFLGDGPELPNRRARFVMTPERYASQLKWVDQVLADVMQGMSQTAGHRASKLIVLSDHNARAITPPSQHEHVVFAVRDSRALEPRRVDARAHAGDLLRAELAKQ